MDRRVASTRSETAALPATSNNGYLSLDAAGRTGADNPITKLKVRQAIWHAIDRQAIADKLVTGGSRVPPAPCFPPQFGCDAEAASHRVHRILDGATPPVASTRRATVDVER